MQYVISNRDAGIFASKFYDEIRGVPVDEAVRRAARHSENRGTR